MVSILWSLAAVYLLLAAWEMWNGMFGSVPSSLAPEFVQRAPYLAIVGVACSIVGFGLWNMQNWARIATLFCLSLDLARAALTLPVVAARGAFLLLVQPAIEAAICVYLMSEVVSKKFQEWR